MRARTLRVSTIGDRSVQASLRRPLPLIVSEPAVTMAGAAINARVAPVAFSEHHRSRNARSRRLPWSVVPDRNADAPRAELRDDRTGAGVDQPAASGQ